MMLSKLRMLAATALAYAGMTSCTGGSSNYVPLPSTAKTGTRTLPCQYNCTYNNAAKMTEIFYGYTSAKISGTGNSLFSHLTWYVSGHHTPMVVLTQNNTQVGSSPVNRINNDFVYYQVPVSGTFDVQLFLKDGLQGGCNVPSYMDGANRKCKGFTRKVSFDSGFQPNPDDSRQAIAVDLPNWYGCQ